MAHTRALSRPILIAMPRRGGGRFRRRARVALRRGGRRVGRAARRNLPVMGMAVAGAALGFASSKGLFDKLPQIGGSKVLTLGIAGWAATKFVPNATVKMAGIALLTTAAFDWGRVQGGGTSGLEESEVAY